MSPAGIGEPFPLWPGAAPGALGEQPHDIPTLTAYLPSETPPTGGAMVVCPGGGYANLAAHEGHDYALWLNARGITAFVLRYRLGSNGYRHPHMFEDVTRALRLVRASAERWRLDASRIGVMGSSAGGHLAATLLTRFDAGDPGAHDPVQRVSSRPDLGILCYPVISMGPIGHAGSRQNLLGERPSDELIAALSNEFHVTAETPPCFIWHTWEDASVPVENSIEFAAALRRHGVPFDLHIYQLGRHGLGLGDGAPHDWTRDLALWLRVQRFTADGAARCAPTHDTDGS